MKLFGKKLGSSLVSRFFVIPAKLSSLVNFAVHEAGIFFLCSICLSACAVKVPQKSTYTLSPQHYHRSQPASTRYTILVNSPTASVGFDTKKMLYSKKAFEINAFSKNQWAGPPAKMLHPLLIQYLRETGYFNAVVAPPISAEKQWMLKTHLLELQQDFTSQPSCIHMAIQAEIIDKVHNRVVSSQLFAVDIPAPNETPYGGVIASNRAAHILLNRISRFCVQHLTHNKVSVELPTPILIPAHAGIQSNNHFPVIPANAGI